MTISVAHSRLLLEENADAAIIQADVRQPTEILAAPETQLLLDFGQPIAVILGSVLHFVPDNAEASAIVATLREALVPGSHVVIVHACRDGRPEVTSSFEKVHNERVSAQLHMRTREEIKGLFMAYRTTSAAEPRSHQRPHSWGTGAAARG